MGFVPAALAIGGAVASAIGKSGKQGSVTSTNTSISRPDLPDWLSQFYAQIPAKWQQQYFNASRPLIGGDQIANYLANANRSYQTSVSDVMGRLARVGGLSSGRAASVMSNLASNQANNIANYTANVPVQNRQYSDSQLGQLLQMGMNWKPPVIGETTTSTGTQTQQGPSFFKSLMGNLGGVGMMGAMGAFSNPSGATPPTFGNPGPATNISAIVPPSSWTMPSLPWNGTPTMITPPALAASPTNWKNPFAGLGGF